MSVIESTIETLSLYADGLLQVCEDALALTDAGIPERVYVSPSVPAIDCEQLTLYISAINEAPTSPLSPPEITARRATIASLIMVSYVIDVVRCSANMESLTTFPTVTNLIRVAHTVQDDMFAVWNGVRWAHQNGEIFDGCLGVHFDGIVPLRDQGGYCGMEMRLRAHIPGVPNPIP